MHCLGAIIIVFVHDTPTCIEYVGTFYRPAEQSCPTHDRECMGVAPHPRVAHHTLTHSATHTSRRHAQWLEFLASFQPNVEHVQGSRTPADA
jgi:hypothetical protein